MHTYSITTKSPDYEPCWYLMLGWIINKNKSKNSSVTLSYWCQSKYLSGSHSALLVCCCLERHCCSPLHLLLAYYILNPSCMLYPKYKTVILKCRGACYLLILAFRIHIMTASRVLSWFWINILCHSIFPVCVLINSYINSYMYFKSKPNVEMFYNRIVLFFFYC